MSCWFTIPLKKDSQGYRAGEMSWILEENVLMRDRWSGWGRAISKVYRIYEKAL